MTSQLTFADIPHDPRILARTENAQTSHAAARACRELCSEHHQIILRVLQLVMNANADEIAVYCSLRREQIGRRLNELERAGYVRVVEGVEQPTASGRMARCYAIRREA